MEPTNKKAQEQLSKLQKEFLEVRQEGKDAEAATGGEEKEEEPRRMGRRIQIKEVEGSESEDESEGTPPLKQDDSQSATRTDTTSASHSEQASSGNSRTVSNGSNSAAGFIPPSPVPRPPSPPPLPPRVKELKEKGNRQFRSGQYGDALLNYSKAIQLLEAGMFVQFVSKYNHPVLGTSTL